MAQEKLISWGAVIIQKLNAWFKIDTAYYLKSSAQLLSTYGVDVLRGIVFNVLVVSMLASEPNGTYLYGEYKFVLGFLPILTYVALPGGYYSVVTAVARGADGVFRRIMRLTYSWALLALPLWGLFAYYAYFSGNAVKPFLILLPLAPLYAASGVYVAYYYGKEQFAQSARITNSITILTVTAQLGAFYFWRDTITLLLTYVIVYSVLRAAADVRLWRSIPQNAPVMDADISFAKKMSWIQLIGVLRSNIDRILLGSHKFGVGYEMLAQYAVAAVLPDQFKAFVAITNQATFARFSKRSEDIYEVLKQKMGKLILVALAGFAAVAVLTPVVIPLIFSRQYAPAVPISLALLATLIMPIISAPYLNALTVRKEVKKIFWVNTIFSVTELVALIIMIPLWGVWGAVGAKAISRTTFSILLFYLGRVSKNPCSPPHTTSVST